MTRIAAPERRSLFDLVLAGIAAGHVAAFAAAGPLDDDFIVHRYARNLIEGHGLVFNPGGEVAEGFTSPLWLGLSALMQSVGLQPALGPSWVLGIGALAAAVAAVSVARAARMSGAGEAGSAALGLAVGSSPALAFHAVGGLGTVVVAAALAAGGAAWLRAAIAESTKGVARPAVRSGLFFALACATRQEAALVWLPFAFIEARRVGLVPSLRASAPAAAVLLGWTVFRWATFGRLDPVTHAVKKLPLTADLGYGASYAWTASLDALMLPLALVALMAALHRGLGAPARALAVGVLAQAAFVVYVGGDWMLLARFWVPLLPLALLVAGVLALRIGGQSAALAAGISLALLLQVGQRQRAQVVGEHRFFEERWAVLGDHFREHAPANSRVALAPIGVFGWRSRLPIVDLLGLTHTQLLEVEPDLEGVAMKGHHRHAADWVFADPPEYMVLGNGVLQPETGRLAINPWELELVTDPRFAELYVHVRDEVAGEPAEWFRRRDALAFPRESRR